MAVRPNTIAVVWWRRCVSSVGRRPRIGAVYQGFAVPCPRSGQVTEARRRSNPFRASRCGYAHVHFAVVLSHPLSSSSRSFPVLFSIPASHRGCSSSHPSHRPGGLAPPGGERWVARICGAGGAVTGHPDHRGRGGCHGPDRAVAIAASRIAACGVSASARMRSESATTTRSRARATAAPQRVRCVVSRCRVLR